MVPNLDGFVLPSTVRSAFTTGQFNRVPVIEGSTHDEWRLFVAQTEATTGAPLTAAAYIPAIAATLGVPLSFAAVIAAVYPLAAYPSPSVALGAVGTDVVFSCNARISSRLLSQFVPTYQYEFSDPEAPMLFFPPVSFPTGAYHASELQYIFNLTGTPVPSPGLSPSKGSSPTRWSGTGRSSHAAVIRTRRARRRGRSTGRATSSSHCNHRRRRPSTGFSADHKCAFWGLN